MRRGGEGGPKFVFLGHAKCVAEVVLYPCLFNVPLILSIYYFHDLHLTVYLDGLCFVQLFQWLIFSFHWMLKPYDLFLWITLNS